MYDYNYSDYLMHYGVKGMKWGVRRYTNADGSLNAKGIKKYARAGYAQDSYNSNKTKLGKAYDKVTGAHKIGGDAMYGASSDKERKARAEKYVADKEAAKAAAKAAKNTPEAQTKRASKRKAAVKIGAAVAGTALATYGAYKVTKITKEKAYQKSLSKGRKLAEESIKKFKADDASFVAKQFENIKNSANRIGQETYAQRMASTHGTRVSDFAKKAYTSAETNARADSDSFRKAIKTLRRK